MKQASQRISSVVMDTGAKTMLKVCVCCCCVVLNVTFDYDISLSVVFRVVIAIRFALNHMTGNQGKHLAFLLSARVVGS